MVPVWTQTQIYNDCRRQVKGLATKPRMRQRESCERQLWLCLMGGDWRVSVSVQMCLCVRMIWEKEGCCKEERVPVYLSTPRHRSAMAEGGRLRGCDWKEGKKKPWRQLWPYMMGGGGSRISCIHPMC